MRLRSLRGYLALQGSALYEALRAFTLYEALQSSALYEASIPTRPRALPGPALYKATRLYKASNARCLRQGACSAQGPLLRGAYAEVLTPRSTSRGGLYFEVSTPRCLLQGAYSDVPTPKCLPEVPTPG